MVVLIASASVGCARAKSEPSAPAPVAARPQPGIAGAPGAAPGAPRRAPAPPNWERQDSVRRALVAEVLRSVAGRENEPAGKVFKSVQLNKHMPVKEFLAMMNEQYGRSVGASCTGCHASTNVAGVLKVDYASDEPKKKQIARQMERMTQEINKHLSKVKELDQPYVRTSCVMCHRGAEHMPNTMEPLKNSETPPTRKRS
ncbi:MAG: c-type cytochrome [Gemmatimonas sp.]